ncbi:transposase [Saccharothrix sp. SC076]|nr:transposase [Saccharothrix obliqua]
MFRHGAYGWKEARPRWSFTLEFKADVVGLCRQGGRSVRQIARDFDLTGTARRGNA